MRSLLASSAFVAVLIAASPPALAQSAPFCLKSSSGMANCAFQSAAQCEAAKGMNLAAQCVPNPHLSTTGQGSGSTTGQGSGTPRNNAGSPMPQTSPSPTR